MLSQRELEVGRLRRGEAIEGLYKAYKGVVEGYIPGTKGFCK